MTLVLFYNIITCHNLKISEEINTVSKWMTANKLTLNINKSIENQQSL